MNTQNSSHTLLQLSLLASVIIAGGCNGKTLTRQEFENVKKQVAATQKEQEEQYQEMAARVADIQEMTQNTNTTLTTQRQTVNDRVLQLESDVQQLQSQVETGHILYLANNAVFKKLTDSILTEKGKKEVDCYQEEKFKICADNALHGDTITQEDILSDQVGKKMTDQVRWFTEQMTAFPTTNNSK